VIMGATADEIRGLMLDEDFISALAKAIVGEMMETPIIEPRGNHGY